MITRKLVLGAANSQVVAAKHLIGGLISRSKEGDLEKGN